MKTTSRYKINLPTITTHPLFQRLAQNQQQTMAKNQINQHDWLQKLFAEMLVSDKPMFRNTFEIQSVFSMAVLQKSKSL